MNRLENLISFNSTDSIVKIGNLAIEIIDISGNFAIRRGYIKTNFKRIYSIHLVDFVNKGQSEEALMQQVMHSGAEQIVKNKFFELYAAGNQTVSVTFIGEV